MDWAADTTASLDPSFVPRFRDEVAFVPVADEALATERSADTIGRRERVRRGPVSPRRTAHLSRLILTS